MKLDIINLAFDYQDEPLLHHINLSLGAGQLLHLRGHNGSGKTTLLKLIAGLFVPHEGDICYQGRSIYKDLMEYHKHVGYVGHKYGYSQLLTVLENACSMLPEGAQKGDVIPLLHRVGLGDHLHEPSHILSMGQRKRLGLLRLFLKQSSIWLLDEPFVGLDSIAIQWLTDAILEHLQHGGRVVLTSHQWLPDDLLDCQEYNLST